MSEEHNFIHAKAIIDGRCIDLLLDQETFLDGVQNALNNPSNVPVDGQCWSKEKPTDRCGLWDRIMNRCCECGYG